MRKKSVQNTVMTVMSIMLLAVAAFPAFAANKINSVSVRFKVEGYSDEGIPDISAESKGGHYSVGSVDLEDSDDKDPFSIDVSTAKYCVDVSADDGYAFYITKASQVKLSGAGVTYVKASRLDGGTTLHLIVKFTKLESSCGKVQNLVWTDNGRLSWEPAANAKQYKLTLFRSGGSAAKEVYTGAPTYDFRPFMTAKGDYYAKVVPMTDEETGSAESSGSCYISAEVAKQYDEQYGLEKEKVALNNNGGPDGVTWKVLNTGWKQNETGWWYQHDDGSYVQYNWLNEGDNWYFFDSDGYMVTNRVVKWGNDSYYFGDDGRMVTNVEIPDGRKAGEDGILTGTIKDADKTEALETYDDSAHGPGVNLKKEKTEN